LTPDLHYPKIYLLFKQLQCSMNTEYPYFCYQVERERDKERLEAKRRLDQLKKSTEEEQEENKKKVTEVRLTIL
jgi:hypothetical protein